MRDAWNSSHCLQGRSERVMEVFKSGLSLDPILTKSDTPLSIRPIFTHIKRKEQIQFAGLKMFVSETTS